jgi:hypothetical protein
LYLSIQEIEKIINTHETDTKAIKQELFKLCWYMRGSITYHQMLDLTFEEREIISKIVEENLKTTKESGLPFF